MYFEELLRNRGYFDEPNRDRVDIQAKEFYLSHKDQFKDYYEVVDTLGTGISNVKKCVHKQTGIERSVKVVRKEDLEYGERAKLL